jgi:hypothetical protein
MNARERRRAARAARYSKEQGISSPPEKEHQMPENGAWMQQVLFFMMKHEDSVAMWNARGERQKQYKAYLAAGVKMFLKKTKMPDIDTWPISEYATGNKHKKNRHLWPEKPETGRAKRVLDGASAGGGCPVCACAYNRPELYEIVQEKNLVEMYMLISQFQHQSATEYNLQHPIHTGEIAVDDESHQYDRYLHHKFMENEERRRSGAFRKTWI